MLKLNILVTAILLTSCSHVSKVSNGDREIASFSTNQNNEKVYKSAQGEIIIEKLENEISKKLGGVSVVINRIRWSRNPGRYAAYFIGKMLGNTYAAYVINFKLDNTHSIVCRFVPILEEDRIMVNDCESATAKVNIPGFIYYKDIGLPINIDSRVKH